GFLAAMLLDAPIPVTIALCVVAVSTDLGTSSVWAFCQDIGGRHVGSVLGWGNMWGNVGAAVSPLALNLIIVQENLHASFLARGLAFCVSGIAALGIDATVPIKTDDRNV